MREAFLLFLIHSLGETHPRRCRETHQGRILPAPSPQGASPSRIHLGCYPHLLSLPARISTTEGRRRGPCTAQLTPYMGEDEEMLQMNKENASTGRKEGRKESGDGVCQTRACQLALKALPAGSPYPPPRPPPATWPLMHRALLLHPTWAPFLKGRGHLNGRCGLVVGARGTHSTHGEHHCLNSFQEEDLQLGFGGWVANHGEPPNGIRPETLTGARGESWTWRRWVDRDLGEAGAGPGLAPKGGAWRIKAEASQDHGRSFSAINAGALFGAV